MRRLFLFPLLFACAVNADDSTSIRVVAIYPTKEEKTFRFHATDGIQPIPMPGSAICILDVVSEDSKIKGARLDCMDKRTKSNMFIIRSVLVCGASTILAVFEKPGKGTPFDKDAHQTTITMYCE